MHQLTLLPSSPTTNEVSAQRKTSRSQRKTRKDFANRGSSSAYHPFQNQYSLWDSPDPRQVPESPFPGKEGFGVQKPPFPSPSHGPENGVEKSPFPLCSLAEKRGFFDRKLPFPGWGFGPRNPLFQEMGIRALSGVGGIPILAGFEHFGTIYGIAVAVFRGLRINLHNS